MICWQMFETAEEILCAMRRMGDENQGEVLTRFFKTGEGQYGEGDRFLGIKVPCTREVARKGRDLPLTEVRHLLNSEWHEARLCGFLILVAQYSDRRASMEVKDRLVAFYLENARKANNWDLVDLSCYKILGKWLVESPKDREAKIELMDRLASSDNLWERRISMVSTMATLMNGDTGYTKRYAALHLNDTHDLMHKAVGWMLREMGKRCGMDELRSFLKVYATRIPRTALRYAIERMDKEERTMWLACKY